MRIPVVSTLLTTLSCCVALLSAPLSAATPALASLQSDSIVLGAGCFWGAEKRYAAIPGVLEAVSGYADGQGVEPTYRAITGSARRLDPNNHAEVVKVTFDPTKVSLRHILQVYFEQHDPTQLNRQGNDVGTQYRSIVLVQNASQQALAEAVKAQYQQLLSAAGMGSITTVIKPLREFFPAEDYHQDYLVKNPDGYCPDHSTGVRFAAKAVTATDNSALLKGKQLLVLEAEGYCPYCEKFRKEVLAHYRGSIAVTTRTATQLQGLQLTTPTFATPTLYFLQDGKEVFGHQGALSAKEFYQALGAFQLGDSEAFNVAFDKGTDSRFCKQYEIFKNTPDGVFIDKLSGLPLFDTRDRFDSGSGWLSFTRPVPDSVLEIADHSYGMDRIEIRAKVSGIHLGHVFPDGPGGQPRYCINATVLDFVARQQFSAPATKG
jgi:peptide methionine sulfoxide reductase msrA/msrB